MIAFEGLIIVAKLARVREAANEVLEFKWHVSKCYRQQRDGTHNCG